MAVSWWQMPGPKDYVDGVIASVRAGNNVLLLLPDHTPCDELGEALREAALKEGRQFTTLTPAPKTLPEEALCEHFALTADALPTRAEVAGTFASPAPALVAPDRPALDNAAAPDLFELFLNQQANVNCLIWLPDLGADDWQAWKVFLDRYKHALRARGFSRDNRALFCVPLAGPLTQFPADPSLPILPDDDICLVHHKFEQVVDLLDVQLFTARLFKEKGIKLPAAQEQAAIAIVAHLALFDPQVSVWFTDRLLREGAAALNDEERVRQTLQLVLEPTVLEVLQELADRRGWQAGHAREWHSGTANSIGGRQRSHSALLACDDPQNELRQRIRLAQVKAIFPILEDLRQQMIARLQDNLEKRLQADGGRYPSGYFREGNEPIYVEHVYDLEFRHIEKIIGSIAQLRKEKERAEELKKVRHRLAHCNPLDLKLLLCQYLNELG